MVDHTLSAFYFRISLMRSASMSLRQSWEFCIMPNLNLNRRVKIKNQEIRNQSPEYPLCTRKPNIVKFFGFCDWKICLLCTILFFGRFKVSAHAARLRFWINLRF